MVTAMDAVYQMDGDPLPTAQDGKLRQLVAYWDRKRAGREMPFRADIDPTQIPALLPRLMLVELRTGPRRFFYRLTGTRVDDIFGNCLTGRYLEDLDETDARAYWLDCYGQVAESRRPLRGDTYDVKLRQDYTHFEWVMMPLAAPRASGGLMILVGVAFRTISFWPSPA